MAVVPTLRSLCLDSLRAEIHPSLGHRVDGCMDDADALPFLLEWNQHRSQEPNTHGRVCTHALETRRLQSSVYDPSPWVYDLLSLERLTEEEKDARITGKLRGIARFTKVEEEEEGKEYLHCRIDSYVHPEFWLEFTLPALPAPHGPMVRVQGSTCASRSKPFLRVLEGNMLRFDDQYNLPFYATVQLPLELAHFCG